jgi:hypothetical protein
LFLPLWVENRLARSRALDNAELEADIRAQMEVAESVQEPFVHSEPPAAATLTESEPEPQVRRAGGRGARR